MCSRDDWDNSINSIGHELEKICSDVVYSCAGPRIAPEEDDTRGGEAVPA